MSDLQGIRCHDDGLLSRSLRFNEETVAQLSKGSQNFDLWAIPICAGIGESDGV